MTVFFVVSNYGQNLGMESYCHSRAPDRINVMTLMCLRGWPGTGSESTATSVCAFDRLFFSASA